MAATLPNPFSPAQLTALLEKQTGQTGALTIVGDPNVGPCQVSSTTWTDATIATWYAALPWIPRQPGPPAQQGAYVDMSGALSAANFTGTTPGAQITAAADAVSPTGFAPVFVPSSLAPIGPNTPAEANDFNVGQQVAVFDMRNAKGLATNGDQKAAISVLKIYDANLGTGSQSDNGSTFSAEALLTGGTGSGTGGGTVTGENVALYAGTQRQAASTRNGWAANFVFTTYTAPSATMSSYGLEIDVSNNSGTDATLSTICDGIAVLADGTNRARFGMWVANSGTAHYWDGIHVGAVCDNSGITIDAQPGSALGLVSLSPIEAQGGSNYILSQGSIIGNVGAPGNANWVAAGANGTHLFLTNDGASTVAAFYSSGACVFGLPQANQPVLQGSAAGSPVQLGTQGSDTNIDVQIAPKGTGTLDLNPAPTAAVAPAAGGAGALPATPAGYVTVKINGTARQLAYY